MRVLVFLALVVASGCITDNITSEIPAEEQFNYTILFCGDCIDELLSQINDAKEVGCALYNSDESVIRLLESKNATIVVNRGYKIQTTAIRRNSTGLMHDKFCIFDNSIVWTGSYNPVKRNSYDDVVIINSTMLAYNYGSELEELKQPGKGSKTTMTKMVLNGTLIESYFCAEDNCIDQLQQTLAAANESIYFATYSFTHPKIANELILRSQNRVSVTGMIESGGDDSQLLTLQMNNITARKDSSKALLHHKLFIIDESVVVTGSFNPTRNADTRNDENMLIIHNEEVARIYTDYYKATFE